jgi:hypothetical protein
MDSLVADNAAESTYQHRDLIGRTIRWSVTPHKLNQAIRAYWAPMVQGQDFEESSELSTTKQGWVTPVNLQVSQETNSKVSHCLHPGPERLTGALLQVTQLL